MILIASLIAGLAIFLIIMGIGTRMRSSEQEDLIDARLSQFNASGKVIMDFSEVELSLPLFDRIIRPPLEKLSKRFAKVSIAGQQSLIEDKLQIAGHPGGLNAQSFNTIQLMTTVLVGVFGIVFSLFLNLGSLGTPVLFVIIVGFFVLGYLLPSMLLNSTVKRKKKEMLLSLPSSLDLLTISVEAGLAFDSALRRVTEKYHNALTQEFSKVLSEIQLGKGRLEALSDMGARSQVEEVKTFIQAIVQSEQLGVGISNVLRVQSEEIRRRRRQRAEEKGQKAPLKMLFPMVFCIFPTLFIVLLGPAAVRIFTQFSHP